MAKKKGLCCEKNEQLKRAAAAPDEEETSPVGKTRRKFKSFDIKILSSFLLFLRRYRIFLFFFLFSDKRNESAPMSLATSVLPRYCRKRRKKNGPSSPESNYPFFRCKMRLLNSCTLQLKGNASLSCKCWDILLDDYILMLILIDYKKSECLFLRRNLFWSGFCSEIYADSTTPLYWTTNRIRGKGPPVPMNSF